MRTKTTLFLLVLVVALGGVAYYVHREKTIGPEASQEALIGPEATALDYLRIAFGEEAPALVLQKQESGWNLTAPILWPANEFAVGRLLNQLQILKRESSFTVASTDALAGYGLDPPEGTLTYGYDDLRRTLRIGRLTDTGRNVYLQHEGTDRVLVFNRSILDDLHRPLAEFRSSNVFNLATFEVRSWSVNEAGKTPTRLVRDGEKWRLETPVQTRADDDAVKTLLNSLLATEVAAFEGGRNLDDNALGLASPAVRLTVVGPSNRRESLLLGNLKDPAAQPHRFYARRENNSETIFTVDLPQIDDLRNAQVGLRDRHVFEDDRQQIQSLTITAAGHAPLTLQRLEGALPAAWQVSFRSPDRGLVTMEGDQPIIESLLRELRELQAVRDGGFITDAPSPSQLETEYGLSADATWTINVRTDTGTQTIKLGNHPPGAAGENRQFALTNAGSVFLVDRALGDHLSAEAFHYRNRQLKTMAQGERIATLTIRRLSDSEPVLSVAPAPEQSWADALAGQPPERIEAAQNLRAQLRNLHAQAIVAPEFGSTVPGEATERPWTWKIEVTVALEGGANTQTTEFNLYLDDFRGGTRLLMGVPELGLVAAAEPAFIDAVRPFIFPRPDPGPTPPDAAPAPAETPSPPAPAAPAPPAAPSTNGG